MFIPWSTYIMCSRIAPLFLFLFFVFLSDMDEKKSKQPTCTTGCLLSFWTIQPKLIVNIRHKWRSAKSFFLLRPGQGLAIRFMPFWTKAKRWAPIANGRGRQPFGGNSIHWGPHARQASTPTLFFKPMSRLPCRRGGTRVCDLSNPIADKSTRI